MSRTPLRLPAHPVSRFSPKSIASMRALRRKRAGWAELAVAIVISTAGFATSWASYQASLWNGRQAIHFSRAGGLRAVASRHALNASMTRAVEIGLFNAWVNAKSANNDRLTEFYSRRFPSELKVPFEEWLTQQPSSNPNAALSPFSLPSYRQQGQIDAKQTEAKADEEFAAGTRANKLSNSFTRAAVLPAMAMFFGGIGQVFQNKSLRIGLGGIAILACGQGLHQIISLSMFPPS